jgi:hypothetical protein
MLCRPPQEGACKKAGQTGPPRGPLEIFCKRHWLLCLLLGTEDIKNNIIIINILKRKTIMKNSANFGHFSVICIKFVFGLKCVFIEAYSTHKNDEYFFQNCDKGNRLSVGITQY